MNNKNSSVDYGELVYKLSAAIATIVKQEVRELWQGSVVEELRHCIKRTVLKPKEEDERDGK